MTVVPAGSLRRLPSRCPSTMPCSVGSACAVTARRLGAVVREQPGSVGWESQLCSSQAEQPWACAAITVGLTLLIMTLGRREE